jgi:hypothetical protein
VLFETIPCADFIFLQKGKQNSERSSLTGTSIRLPHLDINVKEKKMVKH